MTNSARLIRGGLSRAETDNLNAEAWRVRATAPMRAAELSRLTRNRAEQTDYRRGIGQARLVQGFLAAAAGDPDIATRSCLEALPDLEPDGPTAWLAWAHILIGQISAGVGETDRAERHLQVALHLAGVVGDIEAQADAAVAAARIGGDADRITRALRDAVTVLSTADLPIGVGRARTLLAERLLATGATAEARAVAEAGALDAQEEGQRTTVLACRTIAARALAAEGDADGALTLIHDSLAAAGDADVDVVAEAGVLVAELQQALGDVRGAIDSLLDVRETLSQSNDERRALATAPLTRRLSEYYAEVCDFTAAYDMLRLYRLQRDRIDDEAVRRRVSVLDVLYASAPRALADGAPGTTPVTPSYAAGRFTPSRSTSQGRRSDAGQHAVGEPTGPGDHFGSRGDDRSLTAVAARPSLVSDDYLDDEPQTLDALTGLPSAPNLHHKLAAIAPQTRLRTVCLALIDIDGLALVNAERGRFVGDSALRQLAALLKRSVPESYMLVRLVGEDFGLLLDETELDDAVEVCERLRSQVESEPLVAELHGRSFTVSIGVAEATTPFDAERLVRVADDALYEAKDAGRNRVAARRAPRDNLGPESVEGA